MPGDPPDTRKEWSYVAMAALLALPGVLIRFGVFSINIELDTVVFGLSILGAAFLLSWGAEVAQLDISQGLALAFLAFIAVLPEYAVDMVFAWKAGRQDRAGAALRDLCGTHEHCRQLAIANMTGANRLLIGLGWATVVLIWWWRSRQKRVDLPLSRRTDLGLLFIATAWAVTIPLRGSIGLLDFVVLVSLFGLYLWHAASEEQEHPDLIGPPVAIARLSVAARRAVTIAMFVYAAGSIIASAEPFAHGLVSIGERFGVSPFLLVQWLAPIASEAPEMLIAVLFVLRARPEQGLGALVSSKVNQWTLLVGTLPVVYGLAFGSLLHPMRLDARQVEEVALTAAQSLFAVAVLANLSITRAEAIGLLLLFMVQFGFESTTVRLMFAGLYVAGFLLLLARDRSARQGLWLAARHALSRPVKPPG